MTLKRTTIAILLTLSPAATFAGEYLKTYTQPMEGVYFQDWSTVHLRNPYKNKHEIYVRGEGKMGDLFGVLWLDCDEPKYSNWLAADGFLSQDSVPAEAVKAMRKTYC